VAAAASQNLTVDGPAGAIEALAEYPDDGAFASPLGAVVIAHPHPLFGGTMDNKVVQTLARAYLQCGWRALRFNFRGVGASAGAHDDGRGEADDMLAVIGQATAPGDALALAGFSFGAHVAAQVMARLHPGRAIASAVLVGTAASRFAVPAIAPDLHARTLIVHGEQDDVVPLAAVLDWARPQALPVTVAPGGGHFFHGQLPLLKALAARHVRGCA
jgi:alpha/beta superfamily hydrolase